MYTIMETESPAQFVLFDNVTKMTVAAGSFKEMEALKASLSFDPDELL